ncbi:MAG TPA: SEC-C metal-binding domain-containing protein [Vicinamibacteria bacterium]|nr:SEC-C metal-binding domain-containing protein [Vicinamibacteria bacterium]
MLKAILQRLAALMAPKEVPSLGRNEPCHCGSGRKYKKCCLEQDAGRLRSEREAGPMATGGAVGGGRGSSANAAGTQRARDAASPRARQGNLGRGRMP